MTCAKKQSSEQQSAQKKSSADGWSQRSAENYELSSVIAVLPDLSSLGLADKYIIERSSL